MAEKSDQRSSARLQTDSKSKEMRLNAGNMMKNKANGAVDHSVVRPSIDVSVTGMKQAMLACKSGTPEIGQYLLDECNVIIECKVCLSLFRTLVNFVAHKRSFCTLKYSQTRHKDVRECSEMLSGDGGTGDRHPTTATVFVTPEDPVETLPPSSSFELKEYSPTIDRMKEFGIISEIENRPLFDQLRRENKPTIEGVAAKLKRRVDQSFDADYYAAKELRLERMRQTDRAVFQTEGLEGPTMGEKYLAWQTEKQLATVFVGPDGKAMSPGDAQSNFSDSSKENNCTRKQVVKKYCCPKKGCGKSFFSVSSVKRHLQRSHGFGAVQATNSCQSLKTRKCLAQVDDAGNIVSVKHNKVSIPSEKVVSLNGVNVCNSSGTGPKCPKCFAVFSKNSGVSNHVKFCNGKKMSQAERRAQRIRSQRGPESSQTKYRPLRLKRCSVELKKLSDAEVKKWISIQKPIVVVEDVGKRTSAKLSMTPTKTPADVRYEGDTESDEDPEVRFKESPDTSSESGKKRVTPNRSTWGKELSLLLTPLQLSKESARGASSGRNQEKPRPMSVALRQMKLTEMKKTAVSSRASLASSGQSTPLKDSDDEIDGIRHLRRSEGNPSPKMTPLSNSANIKRSSVSKEVKEPRKPWTATQKQSRR